MKYADMIEKHYSDYWSPPIERIRWQQGPIGDLPADFRVLVIERSLDILAFATCSMSLQKDEQPIELHLFAPRVRKDNHTLAELLVAIAHYHRTGNLLGVGHSVNFGRPWLPGSTCTHGLISLPYLDGPNLEYLQSTRTRFLWLIPVTSEEVEFKKRNGLEALEECFEKEHFDYLDPMRSSVV